MNFSPTAWLNFLRISSLHKWARQGTSRRFRYRLRNALLPAVLPGTEFGGAQTQAFVISRYDF